MKKLSHFILLFLLGYSGFLFSAPMDSHYLLIKFPRSWGDDEFIKVDKITKKEKIFYTFKHCHVLPLASKPSCQSVGKKEGYLWHEVDGRLFPDQERLKELEVSFNELFAKWEKVKKEYREFSEKFYDLDETYHQKLNEFLSAEYDSYLSWEGMKILGSFIVGAGAGAIPAWMMNNQKGTLAKILGSFLFGTLTGSLSASVVEEFFQGELSREDRINEFNENNKELYDSHNSLKEKYHRLRSEYYDLDDEVDAFSLRYESKTKILLVFDMNGNDYLDNIVNFQ